MIVGLLSDTHGNVKRTAQAAAALKLHAPAHIIHCGDIGSSSVITELAVQFSEPDIPVTCVLGNVDGWDGELVSPVRHIRIAGRLARLELNGHKIAVAHGDDPRLLRTCIVGGQFDFVFTGHTHMRSDEQHGHTRVINPGAIHRATEPGCAVLDLASGELRYLDIV